jgi:lysozyme
MKVNENGIALICEFEGCRTQAYQDPVGVWTIGYGHTSMAGSPEVTSGLAISGEEARTILCRDLEVFSSRVRASIRTLLNDNQFSALVSFAFNVGLGNFRESSVLTAVNSGDFGSVPLRLALWVKAGGTILPGLIRRRAAEGALFIQPDACAVASMSTQAQGDSPPLSEVGSQVASSGQPVEPVLGKRFQQSYINIAAVLSGIGGLVSSAARYLTELFGEYGSLLLEIGAVSVVVLAAVWIIYERQRKAREDGF